MMCPMCPDFCSEHRTSDTTGRPNSFLRRNWSCGPWPVTGRQLNAMPGRVSESCNGSNPQRPRPRCARTSTTRGSATTFGGRTNIPSSTWKRWTRRWHAVRSRSPSKIERSFQRRHGPKKPGTFWTFWKEQEVYPYSLTVLCHHPFGKVLEFSKTAYQLTSEGLCQSGKLMVNIGQPLWVHDLFETHKGWVHAGFLDAGRWLWMNLAAILRRSLEGDKVAQDIRPGDGHFFIRDFWPLLQFSSIFLLRVGFPVSLYHLWRPGRGGKDADWWSEEQHAMYHGPGQSCAEAGATFDSFCAAKNYWVYWEYMWPTSNEEKQKRSWQPDSQVFGYWLAVSTRVGSWLFPHPKLEPWPHDLLQGSTSRKDQAGTGVVADITKIYQDDKTWGHNQQRLELVYWALGEPWCFDKFLGSQQVILRFMWCFFLRGSLSVHGSFQISARRQEIEWKHPSSQQVTLNSLMSHKVFDKKAIRQTAIRSGSGSTSAGRAWMMGFGKVNHPPKHEQVQGLRIMMIEKIPPPWLWLL